MSSSHLITPSLYTAFRRQEILPLLPDDLEAYLSSIYQMNLTRNLQIIRQAGKITEILRGKGIEPVYLKGSGRLLQGIYRDPGDRLMIDIDLLVAEPDTDRAYALLQEAGYIQYADADLETYKRHHHLPALRHPDEVAFIELHRTVVPRKHSILLPVEQARNEQITTAGDAASVLSVSHQIRHLFIHDFLVPRYLIYGAPMLRSLYDHYLLRRQECTPAAEQLKSHWQFGIWCAITDYYIGEAGTTARRLPFVPALYVRYIIMMCDHPLFARSLRMILRNSSRIVKIIRLFSRAPFDSYSRNYIRKKAGSAAALSVYFKKLMRENGFR
jgi:hypothetical protein